MASNNARSYTLALVHALGVEILRRRADAGDREAQWSLARGVLETSTRLTLNLLLILSSSPPILLSTYPPLLLPLLRLSPTYSPPPSPPCVSMSIYPEGKSCASTTLLLGVPAVARKYDAGGCEQVGSIQQGLMDSARHVIERSVNPRLDSARHVIERIVKIVLAASSNAL